MYLTREELLLLARIYAQHSKDHPKNDGFSLFHSNFYHTDEKLAGWNEEMFKENLDSLECLDYVKVYRDYSFRLTQDGLDRAIYEKERFKKLSNDIQFFFFFQ